MFGSLSYELIPQLDNSITNTSSLGCIFNQRHDFSEYLFENCVACVRERTHRRRRRTKLGSQVASVRFSQTAS